jgi:hypothetical protein
MRKFWRLSSAYPKPGLGKLLANAESMPHLGKLLAKAKPHNDPLIAKTSYPKTNHLKKL